MLFWKRLEEEKHLCVNIRFKFLVHEFRMFRELGETNLKHRTSQGQVRVAFWEAPMELANSSAAEAHVDNSQSSHAVMVIAQLRCASTTRH